MLRLVMSLLALALVANLAAAEEVTRLTIEERAGAARPTTCSRSRDTRAVSRLFIRAIIQIS